MNVRSLVTECATWADICVSCSLKTVILTMKSELNDDDLYIFRKLSDFSIMFNKQMHTILYNNFDKIAFQHDFTEMVEKIHALYLFINLSQCKFDILCLKCVEKQVNFPMNKKYFYISAFKVQKFMKVSGIITTNFGLLAVGAAWTKDVANFGSPFWVLS